MAARNKDPGLFEKPTVNVQDPDDVRVWTEKLDISRGDLVFAVQRAGNSSHAVLAHLLPLLLERLRKT